MDHQAIAQLLANYGEFLGSIGVLATLLYLAIQVRQSKESMDANTRAVKAQISQARADNVTAMLRGIVHSDYLARIGADRLAASDTGEWVNSLSPEDRYRWRMHLLSQFNDFRNQFYQYQQGFLDEEIWNTSTRGQIARVLGDLPYFIPVMQPLDPEFKATLNAIAQEEGLPPVDDSNSFGSLGRV